MSIARRCRLLQVAILVVLELKNAVASRLLSSARVAGTPFQTPIRLAYDYSAHGQDWVQGQCGSRERGSPINFDDLGTLPTGPQLYFNYINASERFHMYNDGNQIQAFFTSMGYGGITWMNGWYNLDRIEFHSYSEHTFMGMHYPLEMHIIHTRDDSQPDGPPLMIVAVMFETPKYKLNQKVDLDALFKPPPAGPAAAPMAAPLPAPAAPAPGLLELKKHIHAKNRTLSLAAQKVRRSRRLKVQEDPEAAGEEEGGDEDTGDAPEKEDPMLPPSPAVPAAPEGPPPYEPPSPDDEGWNKVLQAFLSAQLPQRNMQGYQPLDNLWQLDLNPMLENGKYFRYTGAMTYPPCNEEPVMFVRRNPHMASDAQVKIIHDKLYEMNLGNGNYRSVLPLNNRPLTVMTAKRGEPPLKADVYNINTKGTNPVTERELRAMKWSQRALKVAEQATMHAKELDERMRRAAEEHLNAQSGLVSAGQTDPLYIRYGATEGDPTDMAGMEAAIKNEADRTARDHITDMRLNVPDNVKQAAETHLDKAAEVVAQYQGGLDST